MARGRYEIGRRIVVYGVTGSGKTTLARRLGAALDLGVIEMDAIRHDGGWDATPFDEMRERVAELLDGYVHGWVCEGNYSRVRDVALTRADTVIWLRLPWRVSFWRLLERTLRRAWTQEPLYAADRPRESLRTAFLSRQSILWWAVHHHRASARNVARALEEIEHSARVYVLRSDVEVEDLLRDLSRDHSMRTAAAVRINPSGRSS